MSSIEGHKVSEHGNSCNIAKRVNHDALREVNESMSHEEMLLICYNFLRFVVYRLIPKKKFSIMSSAEEAYNLFYDLLKI